jgi:Na+-translocating ferredoxin:NAD+ oxidoreductase RnfG subunit
VPKKLEKKISKEIEKAFDTESFILTPLGVSDEINLKLPIAVSEENLFEVKENNVLLGYAFIGYAPSKTATFDYLVLFDANLVVKKSKVLMYREEYGGEIASKRWLKQFIGKTYENQLLYQKDIAGISGATISVRSMTNAVNNVFKTVTILHENKIL